ncbi:hypothetical protein EX30DRAFT_351127 [Ascodesmis nigricans]|uniref:Uncharacterized protein n=1 Tax=Ascodesmis nigricans TaxID=341454 RepID=A0A4S2MMQ2_9PEZI|nr:hypothetical protein EX30DRAFT_351127 [Ascodesmis nigricans]
MPSPESPESKPPPYFCVPRPIFLPPDSKSNSQSAPAPLLHQLVRCFRRVQFTRVQLSQLNSTPAAPSRKVRNVKAVTVTVTVFPAGYEAIDTVMYKRSELCVSYRYRYCAATGVGRRGGRGTRAWCGACGVACPSRSEFGTYPDWSSDNIEFSDDNIIFTFIGIARPGLGELFIVIIIIIIIIIMVDTTAAKTGSNANNHNHGALNFL